MLRAVEIFRRGESILASTSTSPRRFGRASGLRTPTIPSRLCKTPTGAAQRKPLASAAAAGGWAGRPARLQLPLRFSEVSLFERSKRLPFRFSEVSLVERSNRALRLRSRSRLEPKWYWRNSVASRVNSDHSVTVGVTSDLRRKIPPIFRSARSQIYISKLSANVREIPAKIHQQQPTKRRKCKKDEKRLQTILKNI